MVTEVTIQEGFGKIVGEVDEYGKCVYAVYVDVFGKFHGCTTRDKERVEQVYRYFPL